MRRGWCRARSPRSNIFAYDITTGNPVAAFNHSLNAQGLVVRGTPDGSRVYVGGDFTDGRRQARGHVAAFDTATGALTGLGPELDGQVRGSPSPASTVYVGGNFRSANGQARTQLAAFDATGNAALTAVGPRPPATTATSGPWSCRPTSAGSSSAARSPR